MQPGLLAWSTNNATRPFNAAGCGTAIPPQHIQTFFLPDSTWIRLACPSNKQGCVKNQSMKMLERFNHDEPSSRFDMYKLPSTRPSEQAHIHARTNTCARTHPQPTHTHTAEAPGSTKQC